MYKQHGENRGAGGFVLEIEEGFLRIFGTIAEAVSHTSKELKDNFSMIKEVLDILQIQI